MTAAAAPALRPRRDSRRLVVRRSGRCAYCGAAFAPDLPAEDEHVIGRRFVPRGTLAAQWNLIVSACGRCNDAKAALENDISAITMQPDPTGAHACDDPRLAAEARRKSRTTSARTGRFVGEPEPPIVMTGRFGPATITLSHVGPPQADERRLFELARMQLAGFFHWLTWREEERQGYWWPGAYMPLVSARSSDWGNPVLDWIGGLAARWDHRLLGVGADGFFKVMIRKHPEGEDVWVWVLEWNRSFRLAGLFGDEVALRAVGGEAPPPRWDHVQERAGETLRWRREIPLAPEDDRLFDVDVGADP